MEWGQNYDKEAREERNQVEAQEALIMYVCMYVLTIFWGMNEKVWPEEVTGTTEEKG